MDMLGLGSEDAIALSIRVGGKPQYGLGYPLQADHGAWPRQPQPATAFPAIFSSTAACRTLGTAGTEVESKAVPNSWKTGREAKHNLIETAPVLTGSRMMETHSLHVITKTTPSP